MFIDLHVLVRIEYVCLKTSCPNKQRRHPHYWTYTQTVASRIARLRLIQSKLLFTNIFHFDTAEPTSKSKRSSLHHSRTLSLWEQDKSAEEMKTWKQDSLLGAPTWGAAACNACYHSLEQLIAISAAKYMSFYLFINIFRYFF